MGIIDVGTLGKIEAHGAAAGAFLDRVYTGQFSTLKVGMTRYGLLLDESGVIVDDGVIARLGDERFYFTTTTGNSGTLFRELGRLATMVADAGRAREPHEATSRHSISQARSPAQCLPS